MTSLLELPRDVDGDIRCRFHFKVEGKEVDCLDLDRINESSVIVSSLEANISEIINPSLELEGLRELLKKKLVLLYQTTINAKQYLGIDEGRAKKDMDYSDHGNPKHRPWGTTLTNGKRKWNQ
ncbi:DUF4304 domain-containing protein [Caldibacillus thermoamylovorans]